MYSYSKKKERKELEIFIKKRTHVANEILYNFFIWHDNENGNTFENVNK